MIKAFSISENIVYKLFLDYWNPSETLLGAVHCPFFILLKAICYIRWLADFFSSLKKTLLHTHLLSRWCIPHKDFLRLNRNRLVFIWKASNCSEKFRQGCFFWTFRARSFLGDFWDGFACIVWISANMVFGPPFINGRPQKTVSVCWKPFTPVFRFFISSYTFSPNGSCWKHNRWTFIWKDRKYLLGRNRKNL